MSSIDIVNCIPIGRDNAISRQELCIKTGLSDRKVRNMIKMARRNIVILNIQDGSGYFLPGVDDTALVRKYLKQEERRAKSIFWALKSARKYIEEIGGD